MCFIGILRAKPLHLVLQMHISKKYFNDRLVLLFISINIFLALLNCVQILIRLDSSGSNVISQYRANLGLSGFKRGGVSTLISFVLFGLLVLVIHIILSARLYPIRKRAAIALLAMGTLLLCLSIIVSNALLKMR